jgi:hypothetical protein
VSFTTHRMVVFAPTVGTVLTAAEVDTIRTRGNRIQDLIGTAQEPLPTS